MLWVTRTNCLDRELRRFAHSSISSPRRVLRGQYVDRGERLVHQQHVGIDDHPGEPTRWRMPPDSSLGYAASKPSRPIRSIARLGPTRRSAVGDPAGLQPELDVLAHGQPGQQGEGSGTPSPCPGRDRRRPRRVSWTAGRRIGKPGDAAQQRRLAAARLAEQGHDLAGSGPATVMPSSTGQGAGSSRTERLGTPCRRRSGDAVGVADRARRSESGEVHGIGFLRRSRTPAGHVK